MRRLFTTSEAFADGMSRSAIAWGERSGKWQRVERGVYADGFEPLDALDRARARVLACGAVARGSLAGVLHELDSVVLDDRPTRRRPLPPEHLVIAGIPCADALQTLVD